VRGKASVSTRALVQRINRKLAGQDEMLRTCRMGSNYYQLGRYYVVDLRRNFIVGKHIELEEFGRELEVLKPWERHAE